MKQHDKRQAGFALILVMIVLAMAVVMSVAYLSIASVRVSSSDNFVSSSRAKYLAESGLEHAIYLLQANPATLLGSSEASPAGPFHVDQTGDSYSFYGVADSSDPSLYTLYGMGTAGNLTRKAQSTASRSAAPKFNISKAMTISSPLCVLPACLTINGDFYVNGTVVNYARINGTASASGTFEDPEGRITTSEINVPEEDLPQLAWSNYKTYTLFGAGHSAVSKSTGELACDDPLANGGAVTAANPGGVVWLKPADGQKVTLPANFKFTGTLIINGDLELDGSNIELTAMDGFPAIVASGSIIVTNNTGVVINGLVKADNGIVAGAEDTSNARTTINGGLVSNSSGYDFMLSGPEDSHVINYTADRCCVYDLNGGNHGSYVVKIENWIR